MFSLESFRKGYETDTTNVVIRKRDFTFFVPKTLDRFIDPQDVFHDFPLWSKIWEASIVLADYLGGIPPETGKRFLEIGCGLGLVGIIASSFGHHVTMTEHNPHALNFSRANAKMNASLVGPNLVIRELDWNRPQLQGTFDFIVGSEVIYKEGDYQPIQGLIETFLVPNGEVILAEGVRKTSVNFFRQMGEFFNIKAQKKVLRSKEEEKKVLLCRMRPLQGTH